MQPRARSRQRRYSRPGMEANSAQSDSEASCDAVALMIGEDNLLIEKKCCEFRRTSRVFFINSFKGVKVI